MNGFSSKFFTTELVYLGDKKESVKFWRSFASASGCRNFWRIFQHSKIGHFSTMWLMYLEKLIDFL